MKVLFYPVLPDFKKSTACWQVRRFHPFVLLRTVFKMKVSMEHWWNDTDRGKLSIEHWWNDTDRGKLSMEH